MKFIKSLDEIHLEPFLLIPILSDTKKHYVENRISFIYFYGLETFTEYILGVNHNDTQRFNISILKDFKFKDVYCYKKKYLFDSRADFVSLEAELVVWFKTNKKLEVDIPFQIRQYWNWYPHLENVNDFIPIMKWLEYCRDIKDKFILQFNKFQITESFLRYNQLLTDLEQIEKTGLYIKN